MRPKQAKLEVNEMAMMEIIIVVINQWALLSAVSTALFYFSIGILPSFYLILDSNLDF